MAVSTLLVGLNELSLTQFSEVVTARGIDRVIVVASNSGFNNSAELSNLTNTKVKALSSSGVDFKLATDNGNKLSLDPSNYTSLVNSGFQFLTADEFKSLSSTTALVSGNLISSFTPETIFPFYNPDSSNTVGKYSTAVTASGIAGFGSSQSAEAAFNSFSALNDLNGTLKLNISAADFVSVLSGNIPTNVRDKSNIVADSGSTPALLQPNDAQYHLYTRSIPKFDGTNRIPNLTSDRTALVFDQYIYKQIDSPLKLSAREVLALPLEGMYIYGDEVILEDSQSNISALLPQLTTGQFQSIHRIVLNDSTTSSPETLEVPAQVFRELNSHGTFLNSQGWYGLRSITNADGSSPAKIRVNGTARELVSALPHYAGYTNFTTQITDIDIELASGSDISNITEVLRYTDTSTDVSVYATDITLTVNELKQLYELGGGVEFDLTYKNLRINDTQDQIQSLFYTQDSKLAAAVRQVSSFTSTSDNTVINLDWNNLSGLVGATSIGQFISNVSVDSLIVSGTAGELNNLFTQFGTDFKNLPVGVEFKITDGGKLSFPQLNMRSLMEE